MSAAQGRNAIAYFPKRGDIITLEFAATQQFILQLFPPTMYT